MKFLGLAAEIDIGLKPHHIAQTIGWYNRWTPDIDRLEKYRSQLLFVCDEFMSARRQHFVIEGDIFQYEGRPVKVIGFTESKYNFLIKNGVALPFPSEDGKVIQGEVFAVSPEAFKKLDKLKQNGVQFYRKRVPIVDPYRPYGVINNHGFDELGFELPPALEGKKYWLGEEHLHRHPGVWMYLPKMSYWEYQWRRAPQLFDAVPSFTPKKDKTWLSEYYKYQNQDS